jgi:hypothetical protein
LPAVNRSTTISSDSPRLTALGLDIASNRVFERATPRAALEVQSLLASPRFAESPSLTAAALGELGRAETLDQAAVLRVAADLSAPGVGDGLIRLERARPDTVPSTAALTAIADGGDWRSADSAAAKVRTAELSRMAATVLRPQPLNPVRAGSHTDTDDNAPDTRFDANDANCDADYAPVERARAGDDSGSSASRAGRRHSHSRRKSRHHAIGQTPQGDARREHERGHRQGRGQPQMTEGGGS